jgi:glycosyltransferase involved in cell wall biosynthesis
MKIVHIYPNPCEYAYPEYDSGNSESDLFDEEVMRFTDLEVRYLAGLSELGHDCVLFYPRDTNVSVKEFRHNRGYRIIRFPVSFSLSSVNYPLKMLWHLLKEKPDVVHFHGIYGGGKYFHIRFYAVVSVFCKLFRIPFFGFYHTGSLHPIPKIKTLREKSVFLRKADTFLRLFPLNITKGITSINHNELKRLFDPSFEEYYGYRLKTRHHRVSRNTIDKDIFSPMPVERVRNVLNLNPDKKYILFVSRIIETKGLHDLLKALHAIVKSHPETELLVVGDHLSGQDDYQNKISGMIETYKLEKHVSFMGRVEHHQGLAEYYNAADVFVLPTYTESFGAVNIEALSCGTPVISTKIEEIPYYVKDGMGILIEPGNIGQLTEALRKVLYGDFIFNKEQTLREMEKYHYLKAAEELDEFYRKAISQV